MCYATKRKIADCVKQLMKKKEIRKITIQDIMDATNMSRQSFYYHFKDIYDVLEWVARYDFSDRIVCEEGQTMEEWALHVLHVLEEERPFFERVVNQIEWPKLVPMISGPIEEQMRILLLRNHMSGCDRSVFDFCVHFVTNSYCYYILDYMYYRKHKTDEQMRTEVNSLLMLIANQPLLCAMDVPQMHARMFG